jgi:hypothetical protein
MQKRSQKKANKAGYRYSKSIPRIMVASSLAGIFVAPKSRNKKWSAETKNGPHSLRTGLKKASAGKGDFKKIKIN